jgi:hypothetical protein
MAHIIDGHEERACGGKGDSGNRELLSEHEQEAPEPRRERREVGPPTPEGNGSFQRNQRAQEPQRHQEAMRRAEARRLGGHRDANEHERSGQAREQRDGAQEEQADAAGEAAGGDPAAPSLGARHHEPGPSPVDAAQPASSSSGPTRTARNASRVSASMPRREPRGAMTVAPAVRANRSSSTTIEPRPSRM